MAAAQKKVVVRLLDSSRLWGYLPQNDLSADGRVELIDPAGRVISLLLCDIRHIAYVRDFNLDDPIDPERLGRTSFLGRPRSEGLWVRLEFAGGDTLEGLARADLTLLTDATQDAGVFMTPPDARSNAQRLFIPSTALARLDALGVITPAVRRTKAPAKSMPGQNDFQNDLFDR